MLRRLGLLILRAVPGAIVERSRRARAAPRLGVLAGLVVRLLGGRPTAVRTGEARGLVLRAEPRSVAWLTGKVEPEVQRELRRVLGPGMTFVDVGASIGFFSVLAARLVGPEGTVLAFEPSVEQAGSVQANAGFNGCANVLVSTIALSDRTGPAHLDGAGEATARLLRVRGARSVPVVATTLDAFLAERPDLVPDVVKIDVEGHEDAVLAGMRETLRASRPVVIVEMHGDRGFLERLAEAGYTASVLGEPASPDEAPWWAHVLAVPASDAGERS